MTISSSQPIRVMVVDDHTMVRWGLATLFTVYDDIQLVGEAENGADAIQLCGEIMPDVILMDMVMPGLDGVSATRSIRNLFPQVQVIALTSYKDGDLIKNALEAGAIGYLLKDVSADVLIQAIRAANFGRAILSQEVLQAIFQTANSLKASDFNLTSREREILTMMIEGLNNKQIAIKLTVSLSTIKSHVSKILSKLGVESRTEAVMLAMRNHIVS